MIITICGSCEVEEEMMEVYKILTDQGHIVLLPQIGRSEHDLEQCYRLHAKKIYMSDAIYVVDIGECTNRTVRREISAAAENGKDIYFYSDHDLDVSLE